MGNYTGYIYKITNNFNGHSYIGKTNNIQRRWREHKGGRGGTAILDKAFHKYGIDNFTFSIVRSIECATVNVLNKVLVVLEIFYINHFNTFNNGYNATIGGEGICSYKHSEETKLKIAKGNKGKVRSEEAKQKSRLGMLGKHHSREVRERIRQALLSRDPEIYKRAADKRRGVKRDKDAIMRGALKRRKPILQYSIDGKFIREHSKGHDIPGTNNANIIACCKGKLNSAYGFIWRYKTTDDYPVVIDKATHFHISNRAIIQYTPEGELVSEYSSITKAAEETNILRTNIGNCLNLRSKTAGGYLWKYKDKI